jgi:hypothetical protein
MSILTKEKRQQIVDDYIDRHGQWDPKGFWQEVEAEGQTHVAASWFEWDKDEAFQAHNARRAYEFALYLDVEITMTSFQSPEVAEIVVKAPAVFSPLSTRSSGGGFVETAPGELPELCRNAAARLRYATKTFEAAFAYAGIDVARVEAIAADLDAAGAKPYNPPKRRLRRKTKTIAAQAAA